MTRTCGLIRWAFSSAPFEIVTKKGLPSEPRVTPTFFSSLAPALPASASNAASANALMLVSICCLLPGVDVTMPPRQDRRGTGSARSLVRRIAMAVTVENDGADDDDAFDDVLPDVG